MRIESYLAGPGPAKHYRAIFEDGSRLKMDATVFDVYQKLKGLPALKLIELFQLKSADMQEAITDNHVVRCRHMRRLLLRRPRYKSGEWIDAPALAQERGITQSWNTMMHRLRRRTLDEETLSALENIFLDERIIFPDNTTDELPDSITAKST